MWVWRIFYYKFKSHPARLKGYSGQQVQPYAVPLGRYPIQPPGHILEGASVSVKCVGEGEFGIIAGGA